MLVWKMLHPKMTMEMLGLIPEMLSEHDPRPAREQFDQNYRHGGGWSPMPGFERREGHVLKYPGDPPLQPLARTQLRSELIVFYEPEIVAIFQQDGSFEACRMN